MVINNHNIKFQYIKNPSHFEQEAQRHLIMNSEGFELKSPCMKGSIKIRAPNARIATYGDRFEELKILEEQMLEMSKLPDFGYENDNYSLLNTESDNPKRNWNVLGSFLESTDKF